MGGFGSMKTADPELMRAINRFHVLDIIRRTGSISRVEIGQRTQLSATTISAITATLLDDRLITPHHEGDLRGSGGRGRPRVMLTLNASAARIVGAKLLTSGMVFVVTDFQGDTLASLEVPVRIDRLPLPMVARLHRERGAAMCCRRGSQPQECQLGGVVATRVDRARIRHRSVEPAFRRQRYAAGVFHD